MKKIITEGHSPQVTGNCNDQATATKLTNENGLPKVGKIKQAAADFDIPVHALRTWIHTGVLPCVLAGRVYLINYEVLAEFLKGQCLPTTEQSVSEINANYTPKEPKTVARNGKSIKVLPPIV